MQHLYRHYDKAGNLLYVGVSLSAIKRLSEHKKCSHWFDQIANVTIEIFESRQDVLEAERNAITNENPIHNLYRPIKKEQSKTETHAEESKKLLTQRLVHFNPLYSVSSAAAALNTSPPKIKDLIETGKLGAIIIREDWDDRWQKLQKKYQITGWQLIDFLENLEAGKVSIYGDKRDKIKELVG